MVIMSQHPAMVRGVKAVKAAAKPETTFLCLSNSNSVYIDTILKVWTHHGSCVSPKTELVFQDKGLDDLFVEIVTNPAKWEDSGLLNLRRRVDPSGPQHSCKVGCQPNMCKGEELEAFLRRHGKDFDRIIYVGDGSNDFCPILRLRK